MSDCILTFILNNNCVFICVSVTAQNELTIAVYVKRLGNQGHVPECSTVTLTIKVL